ncbi:ABC transporter permease [Clostridium sp. CX1]|uniref:ABC transporter permease n=1 Tax=Clostridium tanneri TaxID=3037988 RepID=A0ABU4JR62_9CLOT|nr:MULTISPECIES: ABC transporter permease [unclassified Clostridium]MCT8977368.1 ABC transporter permease [Clostridium sp. CX1]MDW8800581.1 ABC transporter permease [Clostridium sp. A1-XYC3]
MNKARDFIKNFGWPRIIIGLFLVSLFIAAPFFGVREDMSLNDVIVRFGMNAVLVLAMVPMIQSGCGLNFGSPVGLVAGLLGAVMSLEFNLTGITGILVAFGIAIIVAVILGYGYGKLLNKVKGDEMIIATYVGYSFVFFMNMLWIALPFKNPASVQGFKGEGLRVTISVENYWFHQISDFLKIKITNDFIVPTGMILFFIFMSILVWGFFKTKIGTAITAVGSNPEFARASGIDVDKMRTVSVVLSTVLSAIGMIVYQQSFGFIQMYNAPLAFAFPSVAAILLGGASVNKATITNVVIGTILFQGIVTMTPSVINSAISIDVSEIIRIIVSNGMIVYALTRKGR